jgi:hypothetical protein
MVLLKNTMSYNPDALYRQTPQQLRRAGARGGKATARNRRMREAGAAPAPPAMVSPISHQETTANAITALDSQFPWLRGVERHLQSK